MKVIFFSLSIRSFASKGKIGVKPLIINGGEIAWIYS